MDDFKLSQVNVVVQDEFENWLIDTYDRDVHGKVVGKLKRCTGTRLDYLGMVIDFTNKGEVSFDMSDYVEKMVNDFEEAAGTVKDARTPAADHLFQVREDATKLMENQALLFHNATAKSLYLCKRSRLDIQTSVAFLTTRVREPDEDDWKKLKRLIGYLKGSWKLTLT